MIKHSLKQVWSQRGKNIWIILELVMVFVILWYIVDFFTVMGINAATPIGTDIQNIHRVVLSTYKSDNPQFITYEEGSEEPGRNFLRIVERLRSHPEIESVCLGSWYYPYCTSTSEDSYCRDSLIANCKILRVSPAYFTMFDVRSADNSPESLAGIFTRNKDAAFLSARANKLLFNNASGKGETIYTESDSSEIFITDVVHEMKVHEYGRPHAIIIFPFNESNLFKQNEYQLWSMTDICIKTKPGVSQADFPARFKEEMKRPLAIGNFFLADITPLTKARSYFLWSTNITSTVNYRIGIGFFFLVNIFLGVLGIFWLRIEKRKSEIGIRMSVGSTKAQIMQLMLSESLCLLAIASIPALLVCLNLAYAEVLSTQYMDITASRLLANTLLTFLGLGLTVSLSVWYPAKRSATTQPAEALHDD